MRYLLLLSIIGLFACEKDLPNKPKVIIGKVLDKNENPIPFVFVYFYGSSLNSVHGPDITFYQEKVTNQDGFFSFSQVVPKETDEYNLAGFGDKSLKGIPRIPDGFEYAYFLNDQLVSDVKIGGFISIDENLLQDTLNVKIKQLTK